GGAGRARGGHAPRARGRAAHGGPPRGARPRVRRPPRARRPPPSTARSARDAARRPASGAGGRRGQSAPVRPDRDRSRWFAYSKKGVRRSNPDGLFYAPQPGRVGMSQRCARTLATILLLTIAGVCLPAGESRAQETRGTIFGTVRDTTGGVLPGMSVIVTNEETNVSRDATSNERGAFEIPYLLPGQ